MLVTSKLYRRLREKKGSFVHDQDISDVLLTEHNLETQMEDSEEETKNIEERSVILAPFNSTLGDS